MKSNGRCSRLIRVLRVALCALLAGAAPISHAATVWTGPVITYSQPGTDSTQPANQDRLTPNVWLTRGTNQGLFNAKTETVFTHFVSPADTEWANGTTANYASLTYTNWNSWAKIINGGPPGTVGINAVLHLKSEDIYLDIQFTSWPVGGGFAYQRSTPATGLPSPTISASAPMITNGHFSFNYTADPGFTYVVENSSNLVNWLPVITNVAASNPEHFTESLVPDGSRYYRVGRLPNR